MQPLAEIGHGADRLVSLCEPAVSTGVPGFQLQVPVCPRGGLGVALYLLALIPVRLPASSRHRPNRPLHPKRLASVQEEGSMVPCFWIKHRRASHGS